jgi:hypothetical protein
VDLRAGDLPFDEVLGGQELGVLLMLELDGRLRRGLAA